MLSLKDIEKLATLSRIRLSPSEQEEMRGHMESILGYVEEIKNAGGDTTVSEKSHHHNVFRADENPHEAGIYTEELLREAPRSERGFVKVKKIIA